jgi:hypothetical protein
MTGLHLSDLIGAEPPTTGKGRTTLSIIALALVATLITLVMRHYDVDTTAQAAASSHYQVTEDVRRLLQLICLNTAPDDAARRGCLDRR